MRRWSEFFIRMLGGAALACIVGAAPASAADAAKTSTKPSDDELQKTLTPEQYAILRQKGTERAFTGAYVDTKDPGVYRCAGCGAELFRSQAKFDSGTGWPSFVEPAALDSVVTESDSSYGMLRTEVMCARCGGHLGHVFDDGPAPTGLRYCINSCALDLERSGR